LQISGGTIIVLSALSQKNPVCQKFARKSGSSTSRHYGPHAACWSLYVYL